MGDFKLAGEISLIPIFAQKHLSPHDHNYYQILLTVEKKIIKEPINFMGSLDKQIEDMYNKYISISFNWPVKTLSDCRKNDNIIEITYTVKMPMVKDCIKQGQLISIKDFFELEMEDYYGRIVSKTG